MRMLPSNLAQIEKKFIFLLGCTRNNYGVQKVPIAAHHTIENPTNPRLEDLRLHVFVGCRSCALRGAKHHGK